MPASPGDEQLPELTIGFLRGDSDDPACTSLPDRFHTRSVAPHKRLPDMGAYEWGVSILEIPERFDDWWESPTSNYMRRRVRRAQRQGYEHAEIDRRDYVDDIFAINTSMEERQGRPMKQAYLEKRSYGRLPDFSCPRHQLKTYGVQRDGTLYAYTWMYQVGEMCVFSTILGHGDHLEAGIMSLLIVESLRDIVPQAGTRYAMYNLHGSGGDGLRYFKEKLGFASYRVHWELDGAPAGATAAPSSDAGLP